MIRIPPLHAFRRNTLSFTNIIHLTMLPFIEQRLSLELAAKPAQVAAAIAFTVSKWRARFVKLRLEGLLDASRPGAPRTIDDKRVDAVIAKTLESQPRNATHWSTRTMANKMGLSQTAISRIWRAFGLQPQRNGVSDKQS